MAVLHPPTTPYAPPPCGRATQYTEISTEYNDALCVHAPFISALSVVLFCFIIYFHPDNPLHSKQIPTTLFLFILACTPSLRRAALLGCIRLRWAIANSLVNNGLEPQPRKKITRMSDTCPPPVPVSVMYRTSIVPVQRLCGYRHGWVVLFGTTRCTPTIQLLFLLMPPCINERKKRCRFNFVYPAIAETHCWHSLP